MDLGVEPPSITLCLGTSPPPPGEAMLDKVYIYMIMRHICVVTFRCFNIGLVVHCYLLTDSSW